MEFIKLANKLFEARQMSHVYHLQTKNESEHRALNDFYDSILDKADSIIEVYQGQYGVIEGYDLITSAVKEKTSLEYLENLVKYLLTDGKKTIKPEDTHLINILDEIVATTFKAIYKIKILSE